MKKSVLKVHAILLACTISVAVSAQHPYWTSVKDTGLTRTPAQKSKSKFPSGYKLFRLNAAPLRQQLMSITGTQRSQSATIIFLPNASGTVERYEVSESSNFDAALQARYPSIRSFSGSGLDNPDARLRMTINSASIQAMVQRANGTAEWIELYSQDSAIYAVFKSQPGAAAGKWRCGTREDALVNSLRSGGGTQGRDGNSGRSLRTIRLAITCSGEFAQEHGVSGNGTPGDIESMMFHIQSVVNLANEVFEGDLAVHLQLADQTRNALFFNPDTDPYDPFIWPDYLEDSSDELLDAAQRELDARAGQQNYDIGTLFCISNSASAAMLNSVCVNGNKGRSCVTPLYNSQGEIDWWGFYLIFAHEVGHQLGARHAFSFAADNDGAPSLQQVEPGSGITIMGYPGISPAGMNVAQWRIPFFHGRSIEAIQDHLATVAGLITDNVPVNHQTPDIEPLVNRIIPKSTPFVLTGRVTNPGNNQLTYSWEQVDPAESQDFGNNSMASVNKMTGPNWITYAPTHSPVRYFPKMETVLSGALKTMITVETGFPDRVVEAVSSVGRDLNFRLTVRDNVPYSAANPVNTGLVAWKDMKVTVNGNAGPFIITTQNDPVSYIKGTRQTIRWDVNGTNGAPIYCANVKISFSVDGGENFEELVASTPNDGIEEVTLPDALTNQGYIKVSAVDNIFFDTNNAWIGLLPLESFNLGDVAPVSASCNSNSMQVILPVISNGGFNRPVSFNYLYGLPGGCGIRFPNPNQVLPGHNAVVTFNYVGLTPGTFRIVVEGTATNSNNVVIKVRKALYFIIKPGPQISRSPQPVTTCEGNPVSFTATVSGEQLQYQWQRKTNAGFVDMTPAVYPGYGVNTATLSLPAGFVTTTVSGNEFACKVSNSCGMAFASGGILTVNRMSITANPQSQAVCEGSAASFSVIATGTGINYQWQMKPAGIAQPWLSIPNLNTNSNTSTLLLSSVIPAMNGTKYRCVISRSGCNPVFSSEATLTVRTNLQLRFENSYKEGCQGGSTSFTISTGIAGSFGYQWQVKTITQDWSDMTGQTTSTLSLSNLTMAMNDYQYRCKVTQNGCTTTSGVARVSVIGFTGQPANAYPCPGGEARFSVQVSGQPQSYRWYVIPVGGTPISPVDAVANPSAATRELVLANVNASQRGNYYFCKVTYAAPSCTINSASGGLIVQQAPVISTQPYNQTVCAGNDAQFRVETYGGPYTYRWEQKLPNSANYTTINSASASTNTLLIQSVLLSANGTKIRCVITNNTCNISTTSGIVTLTVEPVRIISQPVPVTQACEGGRTFFSVGVNCTTPVLYQWAVKTPGSSSIVNVMNNPSATTNTLLLSNLTRDMHNNKYICLIYNSTSLLSTNMVSLQLLDRISATINSPEVLQICRGSSTTLSVSTTGPVTGYQWEYAPLSPSGGYMAFSEIPSANSSTLSFTGAFAGYLRHGCKYRCKVFSLCENITSGITTIVNVNCELGQLLTRQEAGLPAQYTAPDKDSSAIPVNAEAIILYPVPNSGTFSIRMNTDQYPSIDLKVYDQSGRLLVSRQVNGLGKGSVIPVTVPHAVNGLYQLRISNSSHPETGTVVKTFMVMDGKAALQ